MKLLPSSMGPGRSLSYRSGPGLAAPPVPDTVFVTPGPHCAGNVRNTSFGRQPELAPRLACSAFLFTAVLPYSPSYSVRTATARAKVASATRVEAATRELELAPLAFTCSPYRLRASAPCDRFAIARSPRTGRSRRSGRPRSRAASPSLRGRSCRVCRPFGSDDAAVLSGAPRTRTWNRRFWRPGAFKSHRCERALNQLLEPGTPRACALPLPHCRA